MVEDVVMGVALQVVKRMGQNVAPLNGEVDH